MALSLGESLKRLVALNVTLLELSDRKKSCLIENNVAQLESLITAEKECLADVGKEEDSRMQAVNEIMKNSGQTAGNWTLEDVLPFLSASEGQEISAYRDELLKTIQTLRDNNKMIDDLTKLSLNYVEYMIDTLAGDSEDTGTYSRVQEEGIKQGSSRIIDWRA